MGQTTAKRTQNAGLRLLFILIVKRKLRQPLSSGLFFADIIVSSKGGEWIRARGFSKSKAKEILRILA